MTLHITFNDGTVASGPGPITVSEALVPPLPNVDVWVANYYQGISWQPPVIFSETFAGPQLERNWAASSPKPGIVPVDQFSALFTCTHTFAAGDWAWTVRSDDGFELAVDGRVVPGLSGLIEQSAGSKQYSSHVALTAGPHTITVRYFEQAGLAELHVSAPTPYTAPVDPPPQPGVVARAQVGLNTLADGGALRDAYARGCRFFLVMQDWDSACWLADQPGTTVMYREWTDYAITTPEQQVGALKGATHPKIIYTGPNEGDWGWGWGTPDEIRKHAEFDGQCAAIIKSHSGARYAGLTAAVGNPDFTRQDICDAFRAYYAPLYNAGLIDIDMHLYSPNMQNLYLGDTYTMWYETRWRTLFTQCGFDPRSPSRIYSGEMGMDEGGTGGFPAHNATDADVVRYCNTFHDIQHQAIVVNGVAYPSPFAGGAIFQAGNTTGRWDGYDMRRYFPALQTVWAVNWLRPKIAAPIPPVDAAVQEAIYSTVDFDMIHTARQP